MYTIRPIKYDSIEQNPNIDHAAGMKLAVSSHCHFAIAAAAKNTFTYCTVLIYVSHMLIMFSRS